MDFLLKKVVSLFLQPLPFSIFLLGTGILLLLLNRAKKTRMTCLLLGLCCLLTFSMRINAYRLITTLQSQYQPLLTIPKQVNKIIVLGASVSGGKSLPPNITLRSASLSRLIEGIRLYHLIEKKGGKPELILSGGRLFQSRSSAGVMRNTAVMLGIDPTTIQIENGSKDTHQEALYLKKFIKNKRFILVTSAFHMPRAMRLFQSAGMRPIAAPTQFFSPTNLKIKSYIPSSLSLGISDIAIHEYLGILWAKLNDQITKPTTVK